MRHRKPPLDLQAITAPNRRLDLDADRSRLEETLARLKPRLLVLDPFVHLHRIDENLSGEVAPLLAFLRNLQRRYELAVVLVHHARKAAAGMRAGQALRGSSEFHAWGDSNLYLRRDGEERIVLAVEHRAAPATPSLALTGQDNALALEPAENHQPERQREPASFHQRITAVLADGAEPTPFAELRASCRIRTATRASPP